jgi:hypothetical protein
LHGRFYVEETLVKPPGFFDYLFILAFFVVGNGGVLLAAYRLARKSRGLAQPLYFITAAPLYWFFTYSSWLWLSDMTANNLWPIALVAFAIPTGLCWLVLALIQRRGNKTGE